MSREQRNCKLKNQKLTVISTTCAHMRCFLCDVVWVGEIAHGKYDWETIILTTFNPSLVAVSSVTSLALWNIALNRFARLLGKRKTFVRGFRSADTQWWCRVTPISAHQCCVIANAHLRAICNVTSSTESPTCANECFKTCYYTICIFDYKLHKVLSAKS